MSFPQIRIIDIVQIAIIAVFLYYFFVWVKSTRAYSLIKGILVVLAFVLIAQILGMDTILWITQNLATFALIAVIVIFQPELRKVLESLGQKNFVTSIIPSGKEEKQRFDDKTISELVRASFEMAEVKTGALIVLEQDIVLKEYENTGIPLDSILTSQLLINIFEHNTPLHDGAVLVRDNRIVAATCYLPLSESTNLSKKLGTRHRAGLGISEVSDSLTIIVSEETGRVSTAYRSELKTGLSTSELREQLYALQKDKPAETVKFRLWKGRDKNEETSNR
ncbi:MAG: diadenylate cyclase CdaA [Lachnospiraceae bacterium]|nr:diadenylate cyclase CdaA [Lachnospiraceae bacterium]MDD3616320.1 diadenylate cyclase CdaA [Lachnospiraceae bacterium]